MQRQHNPQAKNNKMGIATFANGTATETDTPKAYKTREHIGHNIVENDEDAN